jgi:MerR family transcriptional regulator, light-induced transcriptional regulator
MHSQHERMRTQGALERVMDEVAAAVTDEFFERHPDWLERYGERGKKLGIEDARYHMRFLMGSVEAGHPELFEDYTRWTARMLQARGIAPNFLRENLEQIRAALALRLEPEDTAFLAAYIERGIGAAGAPVNGEGEEDSAAAGRALASRLFTQAAINGERQAAWQIIQEALHEGTPPLDIYLDVLQDTLYRVGRLWEGNRITVAQEHMATAITQYVVSMLYNQLVISPVRRGRMVLTGVPGELHQVGAMIVADVLEADGWDVRFLGTNVPLDGIVASVKEHEADVLGVSVTMPFNIPAARELVQACREGVDERPLHIIVGGGAWQNAPEAYHEIGAQNCATGIVNGREQLRRLHIE